MPGNEKPLKVGQVVCVKGIGGDGIAHEHVKIERFTKTLIILANGRRFRKESRESIPYSPYGGTRLHATCVARKEA